MVLAGCIALAGCNASTTPTAPAISNISGDYTGTMNDAHDGNGAATATLAQHGNAAGGAISATQGITTITAQLSLTIDSTNAFSGAMVVDYTGGTTCSFSTTGTYNTSTNALAGSYTAVTGCAGDTGTYALTQQCTDTVTSTERRPMSPPAQC
jgi:hypothetical protein